MTPRLILAALIAGLCAGIIMGGIQHFRLTPLIAEAELFEKAEVTKDGAKTACVENMPGMKMCNGDKPEWEPKQGLQRTALTTIATMMTGAGFALLLAGVSLVSGLPITKNNGLIWGICGFLTISLAPAAGLAPELPGMPVADLNARQIWWVFTILSTSFGIWLIAAKPKSWAPIAAVIAIAAPQIYGAPIAMPNDTQVPPSLAAEFVAHSLAANAIFWALIGLFVAHAFAYVERKYP